MGKRPLTVLECEQVSAHLADGAGGKMACSKLFFVLLWGPKWGRRVSVAVSLEIWRLAK
jgi:hypothetical protein